MPKIMFKKCHMCGHVIEPQQEPERCEKCRKSFLPSNYFEKIHTKDKVDFKHLFSNTDELYEEDLIKGFHVLW